MDPNYLLASTFETSYMFYHSTPVLTYSLWQS